MTLSFRKVVVERIVVLQKSHVRAVMDTACLPIPPNYTCPDMVVDMHSAFTCILTAHTLMRHAKSRLSMRNLHTDM